MRKAIGVGALITLVLTGLIGVRANAAIDDVHLVTSPALRSIVGGSAVFGPLDFDVTSNLVVADNTFACAQPANVTGLIAIVDRGNCSFESKAKNAQDGGAVGIVIVNSSDVPFGLNEDVNVSGVTIPATGIASSDGTDLKNDVIGGPQNARMFREDTDGDGIADENDNCASVSNANQANTDSDTQGDACDSDDDNDGVADAAPDNCQFAVNPGQEESAADADAIGDACDPNDDADPHDDAFEDCDLVTEATDGCPDFTRTATKPTYDKTTFTFAGTFTGTHSLCETAFVYLYKERRGADLLMGQTKTANGEWDIQLAAKAKRGKYYAFIDRQTDDAVGECLAISSPIKLIR